MAIVLNGTTGITNDGGYTGDGVVFADTTPANTLVTTTGGNVGIGTSSPDARLHVQNSQGGAIGRVLIDANVSSGYDARITATDVGLQFTAQSNSRGFAFSTGVTPTERARIDSSGNLLVGTATDVLATARATFKASSGAGVVSAVNSNTNLFCINTNNTSWDAVSFRYNTSTEVGRIACTSTATSYVTSSDYRLKENQQPMVGALSIVQQLKPCTYTWKSTGQDGQGFIAHELQAVVPECVVGEKDGVDVDGNPVYQGIDTSFLVATLTAAIQEQQAIITALTARVAALEGK